MARVDFLLDRHSDAIYINELNSLPGFTEGSMFPLLWATSGLAYPALLDRLIELAIERHTRRARLETRFRGGSGSTAGSPLADWRDAQRARCLVVGHRRTAAA